MEKYKLGWNDPRLITVTPDFFYRTTRDIIDHVVAPDMYANAIGMLEKAMIKIYEGKG
jgi:hypothetical protein